MTHNIIILHGYSSKNRGDGLLVEESVSLIREALGEDTRITLLASDPDSFAHLPVERYCSRPGRRGWDSGYLRELRHLNSYDLVVGVGGGYLRAGTVTEALKTALVHIPQLGAAALSRTPAVYLPQSIGPLRGGTRLAYTPLLRRLTTLMLRDDRSVTELSLPDAVRTPDLAITSPEFTDRFASDAADGTGEAESVLTVRAVHGAVPPLVTTLADALAAADVPVTGYIQSSVGGNSDSDAQRSVTPGPLLDEDAYLRKNSHHADPRRVVVAVRLHAALLALRAGHRVIHLSYERKGFSAFADLGLEEWVHNVNDFDPALVVDQVHALRESTEEQHRYDGLVRDRVPYLVGQHDLAVNSLREAVGSDAPAERTAQ